MKSNFLFNYISIKIKNFLSKTFTEKKVYSTPVVKGYTLIKSIRQQEGSFYPSIGIYKNIKNKRVIIKSIEYVFRNSAYYQLINEFNILNIFSSVNKNGNVTSPKVFKLIDNGNRITLITEYIENINLRNLPANKLETISSDVIDQIKNLPTKTAGINTMSNTIIFFSFPLYLLIQVLKDSKHFSLYLSYLIKFYKNYSLFKNENYIFCHRDLHLENILFDGKKAYMIDPEIGVYGNKETDLSIFLRNTHKENLPFYDALVSHFIKSGYSYSRFIGLSIYYTIQIMAIRPKNDDDYKIAEEYLNYFYKKYFNTNNYSLVEIFHKLAYRCLSKINIINSKLISYFNNYKIILCYHSISSDGWRYATTKEEFEKQMKFVARLNPISLFEVFNKNIKKGIVVTFDDGYEDFIVNALPILKKYNVPSTMFILGNPKNANHSVLQNTKKMLSIAQIKSLHKQGIEIGFHTATHGDLRTMSNSELDYEIRISKENLEKKLGFKIRYFAYPRGTYDKRIITKVKEAGFEKALTVNGGTISNHSKDLLINRISIEGSVTINQFVAMVSPLGILFEKFYMGILNYKQNLVLAIKSNKHQKKILAIN